MHYESIEILVGNDKSAGLSSYCNTDDFGSVKQEYCSNSLGLHEQSIHLSEDATIGTESPTFPISVGAKQTSSGKRKNNASPSVDSRRKKSDETTDASERHPFRSYLAQLKLARVSEREREREDREREDFDQCVNSLSELPDMTVEKRIFITELLRDYSNRSVFKSIPTALERSEWVHLHMEKARGKCMKEESPEAPYHPIKNLAQDFEFL